MWTTESGEKQVSYFFLKSCRETSCGIIFIWTRCRTVYPHHHTSPVARIYSCCGWAVLQRNSSLYKTSETGNNASGSLSVSGTVSQAAEGVEHEAVFVGVTCTAMGNSYRLRGTCNSHMRTSLRSMTKAWRDIGVRHHPPPAPETEYFLMSGDHSDWFTSCFHVQILDVKCITDLVGELEPAATKSTMQCSDELPSFARGSKARAARKPSDNESRDFYRQNSTSSF
jgi:hypothetical protein